MTYEVDKTAADAVTRTITYYPVAGAMRIDSTLYYTLKDHLGSASVITDATGAIVGEQRYYPFGQTRLVTGSMYTDRLFTGQCEMAGLGIYHFGARFYSPTLGRFLSADSIVPGAANPQAFNRYAFVLNNPLKYIDPSGHKPCWATNRYSCDLSSWTPKKAREEVANYSVQDRPAVIAFFASQGIGVQADTAATTARIEAIDPGVIPGSGLGTIVSATTGGGTSGGNSGYPDEDWRAATSTVNNPPPFTQASQSDDTRRVVQFAAGAFLFVGGLLVTALGAFLVVHGLIETSTIIGAGLGLHEIPIGGFMFLSGIFITGVGVYLMYDALHPRHEP